jgi:hypothetical protein
MGPALVFAVFAFFGTAVYLLKHGSQRSSQRDNQAAQRKKHRCGFPERAISGQTGLGVAYVYHPAGNQREKQ